MPEGNIRNTKGIAKNTIFLYIRSIVVMAVGIYTSRVVLQTLGVEDYGVYNVIGGFVSMFSILSASLVNASQRFISFEMGKDNPQMNRIFSGTISIHLLLALIVLVIFESFGLWFLNTQLNISADRMNAANWVFQCSVLTFCINLISVPYNASIVAHEKMNVFAYISIYEAFAKLGIVYLLYVTGYDKLIVYAILMLVIAVSLRLLYGSYCSRHFEECKFHFVFDMPLFKEMIGFIGWNFLGSTAGILNTQGINILINIFFGVTLNAARGLADQVNNAINAFVNNFMTALNPQITKSYAAGDYTYMNILLIRGAKYATILYWFFSLVFFVEADFLLDVWLVEVPSYAPLFLRLVIVFSIFQSLSYTLYIGMLATGKIKKYQLAMSSLYFGTFVLCYVFFKCGLGPEFGYISAIIAVFLGMFARLYLLRSIIPSFVVKDYVKGTIVKSGIVVLVSTFGALGISRLLMHNNIIEFIGVSLFSVFFIPIFSYYVALDIHEKSIAKLYIKKIKSFFQLKTH